MTRKYDLHKEHQATLDRPRYPYSFLSKLMFWGMDVLTGKTTTFGKAKLLEILASIPYRAWESRQYLRMSQRNGDLDLITRAKVIADYGRKAQDNEYWHLMLINEKMKAEGMKNPWYLIPLIPWLAVRVYGFLSFLFALFNINGAFQFNGAFEDHAEHVWAQFVADHPEWDSQLVTSEVVKSYGDFETWGDVFRQVSLDERDHMNASLHLAGMPEKITPYEGMPLMPGEHA